MATTKALFTIFILDYIFILDFLSINSRIIHLCHLPSIVQIYLQITQGNKTKNSRIKLRYIF